MAEAQAVTTPAQPTTSPPDPTKQTNAVKLVGAPFQIRPLTGHQRWLKALFYGKHGAGKTDLAGSAADIESMSDVLIIAAESGDMTLENSDRIRNKGKLATIQAQNFKQVGHIHDFLVAHCKHRDSGDADKLRALQSQVTGEDPKTIEHPYKFRTVILDSLSEIEAMSMYGLLGIDTQKMITEDMEVADWPIFRKNFEMVKLLCRSFRNLPMHVIFVCAQQYTQDETKKFHYTPQMTGKLSTAIQGQMDLVGWLTIGTATAQKADPRRLYVQPVSEPGAPRFDAKIRNATWKSPFFDDPTMADIMRGMGMLK